MNTKQKPWSKLQREIYDLISCDINFQIHCAAMRTRLRNTLYPVLPRYWITLDKEIIWDYPKDFVTKEEAVINYSDYVNRYPRNVYQIFALIREYIDTSKTELFDKHFENDKWELTNILKAADRRIGARRLDDLKRKTQNVAASKVLEQRIKRKCDIV